MASKPGRPPSSYRAADLGPKPAPRCWRLMLGAELMAELVFEDCEAPWISVSVEARPGQAPFMQCFADPGTWPDDDPAIDAMLAEAERRGGFRLFDEAGLEAQGFSLVNLTRTGANLRC